MSILQEEHEKLKVILENWRSRVGSTFIDSTDNIDAIINRDRSREELDKFEKEFPEVLI